MLQSPGPSAHVTASRPAGLALAADFQWELLSEELPLSHNVTKLSLSIWVYRECQGLT